MEGSAVLIFDLALKEHQKQDLMGFLFVCFFPEALTGTVEELSPL